MMAVFGVILYLIYLAVCIALAVMGLTLAYMPYVLGGIASLIIYSQNPGIQTPDAHKACFPCSHYVFLLCFYGRDRSGRL